MPEAYTTSNSVVETKPRTREELREEFREEIRLLEMPRIAPEDKERLEREAVETSVGEVELFERAWRKTTPETIGDIERRVDALGTSGLPAAAELAAQARSTPAGPAAAAPPRTSGVDFTPAPAHLPSRTGRPLASRLSPAEQRAIAKHLGGTLTKAQVVFTTSRGRVVDVEYKKAGKTHATTLVVDADGDVATLEAIGQKLDGIQLPQFSPVGGVSRLEEALGPARPAAAVPEAPRTSAPRPRVAAVGPSGRTASGLLPTVANQDIQHIEGVAEVYGKKLRRAGIEIIEDLCVADADDVARRSGISPELVHKWQGMGRLQAVNGIGPQYSELLVRAGVRTMAELAAQKPEALAKKLADYEATLGVRVQGTMVSETQTADWISQAKALTKAAPAAAHGAPGPGTTEGVAKAEVPAAKPKKAKAPEPKKGFGLPFGRKKDTAPAEPPAEAPPEAPADEGGEKPKRKFGLPFGRK